MLYNSEIKEGDKVWWYTLTNKSLQIHNGLVTELIYSDEHDKYPYIITNQGYNNSQEFYDSKDDVIKFLKDYFNDQVALGMQILMELDAFDKDDTTDLPATINITTTEK
jgi:hypothetical protein